MHKKTFPYAVYCVESMRRPLRRLFPAEWTALLWTPLNALAWGWREGWCPWRGEVGGGGAGVRCPGVVPSSVLTGSRQETEGSRRREVKNKRKSV